MVKDKLIFANDLITAIRDDPHIAGRTFARVKKHIEAIPAVNDPCELCRFNPPSISDGKPCVFCVSEGRTEDGKQKVADGVRKDNEFER